MTERADGELAVTMLGQHGATLVPIGVDADGNLVAIIKGIDGSEALHSVAVDANGQLIMVPRGQGGNYLAIDSDGYMTTVIKADYAGTLRTVSVDDEGRLSAYITDPLNVWGTYQQMGLSGLAACLGPAKRYDYRGDILFTDDFGAGLQRWTGSAASANSSVTLSASEALYGGYSVALLAAAEIGGAAQMALELPYPYASVLGVEFRVYLPTYLTRFQVDCYKYDGTNVHNGSLRYEASTTKLQYRDSANAWQDLRTGVTLHGLTKVFGVWKLVADFDTDHYRRSLVNNYYDDMSALALRHAADASTPRLRILLTLDGDESNEGIAYVDVVVVTQNEPANP